MNMTGKERTVKILEADNFVIERDSHNYIASELLEAKKGKRAGEMVQRNQSYHATLEHALQNVRERLRAREYTSMIEADVDALIEAVEEADARMEVIIKEALG